MVKGPGPLLPAEKTLAIPAASTDNKAWATTGAWQTLSNPALARPHELLITSGTSVVVEVSPSGFKAH